MPDRDIWIAERILSDENGEPVVVRVSAPERAPDRVWQCQIAIEWPSRTTIREVPGEDAVQVLQLALATIRMELLASGKTLTWLGEDGDHGFPASITTAFGLGVARQLEATLERELLVLTAPGQPRSK